MNLAVQSVKTIIYYLNAKTGTAHSRKWRLRNAMHYASHSGIHTVVFR